MQKWFFFEASSFAGERTKDLETSAKASKVISSCTSELTSLHNSNSSSTEPPFSSSQRDSLDAKARLTEMKSQSPDKVIGNKIDIFLISKTKLDDSFLTAQFLIEGFGTPYR